MAAMRPSARRGKYQLVPSADPLDDDDQPQPLVTKAKKANINGDIVTKSLPASHIKNQKPGTAASIGHPGVNNFANPAFSRASAKQAEDSPPPPPYAGIELQDYNKVGSGSNAVSSQSVKDPEMKPEHGVLGRLANTVGGSCLSGDDLVVIVNPGDGRHGRGRAMLNLRRGTIRIPAGAFRVRGSTRLLLGLFLALAMILTALVLISCFGARNTSTTPYRTISSILERHGGIPLDTPVFELRDILSEKYGEDSRLIYNLEDQGGEACSLRYDLTVPFARWLAMRTDVQHIKRYQIAKVYRRDQPAIARGRLREFYQCDFDIAGVYDLMIPDAEILRIISEVFEAFEMNVVIKLNHRKVLDGLFEVAGVPADKVRSISSAVDKLDKMPWGEVRKEMFAKGLSDDTVDRVGGYVRRCGSLREMLDSLSSDAEFSRNTSVAEGLADMKLLASYLEALDVIDKISFDLSLARGLDYYTGLIYEVVLVPEQGAGQSTDVGSIGAGGRYDGLVGMYGRRPLPCAGISFGVDRIFTVLSARRGKNQGSELAREADVYIMALGSDGGEEPDGLLLERMRIARRLWSSGLRAEFAPKVKPKPAQQFNAAKGAPVAVLLGQDVLEAGQVRVKRLHVGDRNAAQKDKGQLVAMENLVEEVTKLLTGK